MVDVNSVISTVEDVFGNTDVNRNIEILKYSTEENTYGDLIKTFQYQEVVEAIVTDYFKTSKKYDPFGKYNTATSVVLLSKNYSLTDEDELIIGDVKHIILKIQPVYLGESTVFNRIFVQEKTMTDTVDSTL